MEDHVIDNYHKWIEQKSNKHDASHDIVHIDNVVCNVCNIIESSDLLRNNKKVRDVGILAALSHELCDKKYVEEPRQSLQDMKTKLLSLKISEEVVDMVSNIVPEISFSKRLQNGIPSFKTETEKLAYFLVSDADMLESLGATGVVRTFMFQCFRGLKTSEAYSHIQNRLYNCAEHMYYPYSKKEGNERLEKMKRICEELASERVYI